MSESLQLVKCWLSLLTTSCIFNLVSFVREFYSMAFFYSFCSYNLIIYSQLNVKFSVPKNTRGKVCVISKDWFTLHIYLMPSLQRQSPSWSWIETQLSLSEINRFMYHTCIRFLQSCKSLQPTAFGLSCSQRDLAANSKTKAKASPRGCTREDARSPLHISCQSKAIPPTPLAFIFQFHGGSCHRQSFSWVSDFLLMSASSVLVPYRTMLSLMKHSKKTQLSHPPNTASALLIDDLLLLKIFHLHMPAAQAKMAQSSAIYPPCDLHLQFSYSWNRMLLLVRAVMSPQHGHICSEAPRCCSFISCSLIDAGTFLIFLLEPEIQDLVIQAQAKQSLHVKSDALMVCFRFYVKCESFKRRKKRHLQDWFL